MFECICVLGRQKNKIPLDIFKHPYVKFFKSPVAWRHSTSSSLVTWLSTLVSKWWCNTTMNSRTMFIFDYFDFRLFNKKLNQKDFLSNVYKPDVISIRDVDSAFKWNINCMNIIWIWSIKLIAIILAAWLWLWWWSFRSLYILNDVRRDVVLETDDLKWKQWHFSPNTHYFKNNYFLQIVRKEVWLPVMGVIDMLVLRKMLLVFCLHRRYKTLRLHLLVQIHHMMEFLPLFCTKMIKR